MDNITQDTRLPFIINTLVVPSCQSELSTTGTHLGNLNVRVKGFAPAPDESNAVVPGLEPLFTFRATTVHPCSFCFPIVGFEPTKANEVVPPRFLWGILVRMSIHIIPLILYYTHLLLSGFNQNFLRADFLQLEGERERLQEHYNYALRPHN